MARLLRSIAVAGMAACILTGVPGHAQQSAQQPPGQTSQPPAVQTPGPPSTGPSSQQPGSTPPVFRAGINFVRVDVIVSDKNGSPVGDLKPDDFEVTEENRPQAIETFKLISLDGGLMAATPPRDIRTDLDEELEAARDDVRLFGIFLDDYHVRRETGMVAREQIARFVETQLGPSDMVGVMYPLESTSALRMTRNHAAVVQGIRQFVGRKYEYEPINPVEEALAYAPTETVEKIRNQISMSAIKGLIVHMGGLKEGRKALILVSEGFNGMLPPQLRNPIATMPGMGNPLAGDPDAGVGSIAEERAAFTSNADMEADLRDIYDLANKNNTAIYAVDPRGLAVNEFGMDVNIGTTIDRQYLQSSMETLRTLALQTDGRAIVNRNDLTAGMKQIVRDNSAYYLVGYNSTFTATDGKFHEIKVRVKRPGVQVRARRGYWAFTPEDAARALAPPKPPAPTSYSTALAALSLPAHSRVVRTWVGSERGPDGKTRVTFMWEPAPRAPGDTPRPADVPSRVSLTAVGSDGAPYFRGKIPAAPGATAAPGAKVSFDAPPGKVQLRVSVESADADVIDSEVREFIVPDLTTPEVALGTPSVFRARTVREYQLLKADPLATPTAAREFSRAERVFVRIPAYAPGTSAPMVAAKLLNRAGQPIGDLAVAPVAGASDLDDVELALAPLAPGEYLVEITASGGSGTPVSEVLGFRVTS